MLCEMGARLCEMGARLCEVGARLCEVGALRCEVGARLCEVGAMRCAVKAKRCEVGARLCEVGARLCEVGARLCEVKARLDETRTGLGPLGGSAYSTLGEPRACSVRTADSGTSDCRTGAFLHHSAGLQAVAKRIIHRRKMCYVVAAMIRQITSWPLLVLSLSIYPYLVHAQVVQAAASERIVRLPNGSIYRGELVELVPDDHITIRLATGAVKRFDWASITSVSTPAPAETGTPAPAATPEPRPFPAPDRKADLPSNSNQTVVQIESENEGVALNQITSIGHVIGTGAVGSIYAWKQRCRIPCSVAVERDAQYFISGDGITPSGVFSLPQLPSVTLSVKAGSLRFRSSGLMLTIFGGIAVIGGLSSLIMIPIFSSTDTAGFKHDNSGYLIGGGVATGLGSVLLISGIVMVMRSKTLVRRDDGELLVRLPVPKKSSASWLMSGSAVELTLQGVRF